MSHEDERKSDNGRASREEKALVRRDHALAGSVGSLVLLLGGGGYGVNAITAKLDTQTKEIVELRLAVGELRSARDSSEKDARRFDELAGKLLTEVTDLKQKVARHEDQISDLKQKVK